MDRARHGHWDSFGGWRWLKIPFAKENSHQFRMGDSGAGKTSLTYQDLLDAEANGTSCVVNDAKGGEFIARFYRPERGDVILNPTDDRCAYWNISREGVDLATFKTVMTSLFPPPVVRDATAMIFNQWVVSLGAFLLDQYRPDTETFGGWIANYAEIERRIRGTSYMHYLPANAAPQKAGVLATMALAGDPLWMMPQEEDGRPEMSIREWCRNPRGWVFVSSDADSREALKPLISMWMDLFILNLLSSSTKAKVKLIYDELHTLQTLTRLHDGITMLRSAGTQIIASVQNQEQLKHLYGDQSRTILSQAYTKWIFATSDAESAEILERAGGKRKLLRLEETHNHSENLFEENRKSLRVAEVNEPAVSATQIKGMGDLHAYFIQRGFHNQLAVVPVQIPYVNLLERCPARIERSIPQRDFSIPPAEASQLPPFPGEPLQLPDETQSATNAVAVSF